MANENRLCTLHIPRSALTLQTELLTSSPISPNNQAHPLQETKKHLKMKKKQKEEKLYVTVLSTNRNPPSWEEIQNQKQKNVCARYK